MGRVKKVPMIMQMEMVECGAASLGMVLAYYKKWLPLEQLRKDCGVSRDGCSAKQILMAGRSYGMEATAFRVEPEVLDELAPAVIHWNFNHFVVYCGHRGHLYYINDPARGKVAVEEKEFFQSFTGIALMFKPTDSFRPSGQRASVLGFIRRRLRNTQAALFFFFVTGVLAALVGLTAPLFSQIFMDDILSGKNPDWFKPFMISFGAVIAVQFLTDWLNGIYSRKFQGAMAIEANVNFFWHVLRLPLDFFSQRYIGDLIFRQRSNQDITATLVQKLAPLGIQFVLLLIYLSCMLRYSLLLTCIGLGSMLLNALMVRVISMRRVDLSRMYERDAGKYYGVTMSCLDNMETIKAAGAERGFFRHWVGYFTNMHNAEMRSGFWNLVYGIFPQILQALTSNLILIAGVYLIMDGHFTIGMLMAFQGFLSGFMTPVNNLMSAGEMMIEMRTQMERVEDVFRYPVEKRPQLARTDSAGKLTGQLELRHVTFGYNRFATPQISDFSMCLKPGQSVALVGSSGCGKSTLAKLITGLYRPWEGEILFDGKPIDAIDASEFAHSVALIDQHVVMFDDSVAANIKMWDTSIEDFTMVLACRDAQIREEIISRPEGYHTRLVRGGKNFSGGQLQRMEIATALAREPMILIMDEATSALDATTEQRIMQAVKRSGCTLVVIAHRLSTVRDCDEIIVLDKGVVAERGTHDELLTHTDGIYKRLMESV